MAYWLYKSEPDVWSFDQNTASGEAGTFWDGVRNPLANNHMKAMQLGERGFFYHSNVGKAVVGIVEVVKLWAPDPKDDSGRYGAVTIRSAAPLPRAVTLGEIKAEPRLANMVLVRNSRLSVQPVTDAEFELICAMGGVTP